MKKTPLLIATTNKHKAQEILHFLGDLPFKFLTLTDLKEKIKVPTETGKTLEENAILKARYYGQKSGLICLADDTGLFINALNGWPGVVSARVGNGPGDRRQKVMDKMKNIRNRGAEFRAVLAVYDPIADSTHTLSGATKGKIATKPGFDNGFDYDTIFFVPEKNKIYSEMSLTEKNSCSHRGKALIKTKYLLQNIYGSKHIVVPLAIIVKNGKILMNKRHDPHRLKYHNKWEFPGGTMEAGETLEKNITREAREETGYKVKPLEQLRPINVDAQTFPTHACQVFLIPYICKIINGQQKFNDAEISESRWFKINEITKYDLIGANKEMFLNFLSELKKLINKYHL